MTSAAESKNFGFSLGIASLIGKAINNRAVSDALFQANGNREQLTAAARDKAYIELSNADLDLLLKERVKDKSGNSLNFIDLIKKARDCLDEGDPPPPPKLCC
jgi:hypothetical protein